MKKLNYILKLLIILTLTILFFTCAPQGGGSSGGSGGHSGGSSSSSSSSNFQNIWTNLNPSVKPSARSSHSMTYVGNDKIILFGGIDGANNDETWEYNVATNIWTNLNPATKPSARAGHSMVYTDNNKIIFFGGFDITLDNETWEYNVTSNTWSNFNFVAPLPAARFGHSMVYIGNNKIILFGGDDYSGTFNNETWEFDITGPLWSNLNPSTKPSERVFHTMVYIENDKIILFGGNIGLGNNSDETWEYDITSNTWTNLNPVICPSARSRHSMVYIGNDKIILFGGRDSSHDDETWEYDITLNTWTNLNPVAPIPSARINHFMLYVENNKIILFGGHDGSNHNNETWEYK